MQSPDKHVDVEENQPLQQADGSGNLEFGSGSKSSGGSSGASGEKSTPNGEENISPEFGNAQRSLEDMLKGLIISQIRAPFLLVEEGLINLLKECLLAEQQLVVSASLCGHVDHFQSVDDEDLGWGCGWRNIQILCSFLLADDPESREVLFNGAGFVPDIPALQIWLEIAWAKGFDKPGAEYFNWEISGTRKWIGTTECAALLRSFGVRAKIVSFTALGGKRVRGGLDKQKSEKSLANLSTGNDQLTESSDLLNEGVKCCPGQACTSNMLSGATSCGNVLKGSELCDSCVEAASQQKGGSLMPGSGGRFHESLGNLEDAEDLDEDKKDDRSRLHVKLPADDEPPVTEHNWNFVCDGCKRHIKDRRYKSLLIQNLDLCSRCMKEADEDPTKEGRSHRNYVIIEEHPANRNSGPPEEDEEREEDSGNVDELQAAMRQKEQSGDDCSRDNVVNEAVKGKRRERGGMNVEEEVDKDSGGEEKAEGLDAGTGPIRKQLEDHVDLKPLTNDERGKAGMQGTSSGGNRAASNVNHRHLIEWVWSYFTMGSTRSSAGNNSRDLVKMSERSPLYFQHRGHSRTIVGIERRRNPAGMSEDVYLLVLDPSVNQKLLPKEMRGMVRRGEMEGSRLLVKSLREKNGWQKLMEYDVHSLRETEYQLCYIDPGIAVGEELEQLKVLSSLRYSYFT